MRPANDLERRGADVLPLRGAGGLSVGPVCAPLTTTMPTPCRSQTLELVWPSSYHCHEEADGLVGVGGGDVKGAARGTGGTASRSRSRGRHGPDWAGPPRPPHPGPATSGSGSTSTQRRRRRTRRGGRPPGSGPRREAAHRRWRCRSESHRATTTLTSATPRCRAVLPDAPLTRAALARRPRRPQRRSSRTARAGATSRPG